MSRKNRQVVQKSPPVAVEVPIAPVKEVIQEVVAVPVHRRCPICFCGRGGTGLAYNKQGSTRYYKCSTCAHTWTALVRVEVVRVDHRVVEIDHRAE